MGCRLCWPLFPTGPGEWQAGSSLTKREQGTGPQAARMIDEVANNQQVAIGPHVCRAHSEAPDPANSLKMQWSGVLNQVLQTGTSGAMVTFEMSYRFTFPMPGNGR